MNWLFHAPHFWSIHFSASHNLYIEENYYNIDPELYHSTWGVVVFVSLAPQNCLE